ncbi:helix-turn-helix domain-containing protein [Promicromonospora sukumoe]|uniref:helix-turn-helix domain-containing protein n=1 Tax=Promicromonospora sukumoe TaxID=88382 RepID=UPI002483D7C2|nr:helix-turn-helix transcriptional regulator [Promicromonospora sukumoe]
MGTRRTSARGRRDLLVARRNLVGLSQEALAAQLQIDRTTVARWERGEVAPALWVRPMLAEALQVTLADLADLLAVEPAPSGSLEHTARGVESGPHQPSTVEHRPISPGMHAALRWIDDAAGLAPGEAKQRVEALSQGGDPRPQVLPQVVRADVGRREIVAALASYYEFRDGWQPYTARTELGTLSTSILTRPDWLDLALPIGEEVDGLRLDAAPVARPTLDDVGRDAALQRAAEVERFGTTMVNRDLYRLIDLTISRAGMKGRLAQADFIHYALTLDLLENELVDAIATNPRPRPGDLPLRDRYLPDLSAVLDVGTRLCAGGALALTAIARPKTWRHDGDYLLLIQERSNQVLNGSRRLSVIPKGFHGPLVDVADDAPIGATLAREMEEELFGRADVDSTVSESRQADPMHFSRLSEPMAWLMERADERTWRMECTGFGYNLLTGNYEFASLVVIDDEEWWARFGGQIEANWESNNLRRYSSRDRFLLDTLAHEPAWSTEGLFALLQGFRRLTEIGPERVDLPRVEWGT